MEIIYRLLETALPFSWISYDFMKNAFLAVLLITPLLGITGTMVVQKRMAFFSDALGHSAFTGVAVGVVLGISATNISMLIFAVIFALLLNKIKSKQQESSDTIISVFASCSIAVGLIVLSYGGSFNSYSGLLIGDILSITGRELAELSIVFAAIAVLWIFLFNSFLAVSMNPALARSRGIRVSAMENIFAVAVAVIVMLAIRWVGILLINALMILPAAASKNISDNVREYHFFAVVFSLFSGIAGLLVSFYLNIATGPVIILIASILFFCSYVVKFLQK